MPEPCSEENLFAARHQVSAEPCQRVQFIQIRQTFVVDGKIDIKHVIGNTRNTQVEIAVRVDHSRNTMIFNQLPVIDSTGK